MRDYRLYLRDILEAMEAIQRFIEGIAALGELRQDDKTSSAVVRKLEIIGEAAKGVPEDIRRRYPQIPWREMAGMRDKLIHFYFGIDYKLVWQTIKYDIPPVESVIRQILDELGQE